MNKDDDKLVKKQSSKKSWLMFLPVLFIFSVLLIIISYFISPVIQESISKYLINSVNQRFEGAFEYDELLIRGKHIQLNNFVWKGYCGDTLAEIERLELQLKLNYARMLNNDFRFTDLKIRNGYFRQTSYMGDSIANVAIMFSKGDQGPIRHANKFNLTFEDAEIENFCYLIVDENNSNTFDICSEYLTADKIHFNNKKNLLQFFGPRSNSMDFSLQMFEQSTYATPYPPPLPQWEYLTLEFHDVSFCDSKMSYDNHRNDFNFEAEEAVDYNHVELNDLNIELDFFSKYLLHFRIEEFDLSAVEKSGLEIYRFAGYSADIGCESTQIEEFVLTSPFSNFESDIVFSYPEGYISWLKFANKVKINADVRESHLSPLDLFYLAPMLRENKFLVQNQHQLFSIETKIVGYINKLRLRNINFQYSDQSFLKGQLTLRDVTSSELAFISLRIDQMESHIKNIRQAFPDLYLPRSFDLFKRFNFQGTYDGTLSDFLAYGVVQSSLGEVRVDLSMKNMNRNVLPEYSGNLELVDFDLKKWTDNEELGMLSMKAEVSEGKGLTLDNAEATLNAQVDVLEYNDYEYRNIQYSGIFSKSQLEGKGSIRDKNLGIDYSGKIEIVDSNYIIDARLNFDEIALKKINLMDQDFIFSTNADLNLRTTNFKNLTGYAKLDSLFLQEGEKEYSLTDFSIYSLEYGSGQHLNIIGEGFEARIDGEFELNNFYKSLLNSFHKNNESLARFMKLNYYPEAENLQSNFEIKVDIDSLYGWTKMLSSNLEGIKDFNVFLAHNSDYESSEIAFETPHLKWGNVDWHNVDLDFYLSEGSGELSCELDSVAIGETSIKFVRSFFNIGPDEIDFAFISEDRNSLIDRANFNGHVELMDSIFQIELSNGHIVLMSKLWEVQEGNSIEIGKNLVKPSNFILKNQDQLIGLETIDEDMIGLRVEQFDLAFFNKYIPIEALKIFGNYDAEVAFSNDLQFENISIEAESDQFEINEDDYGRMKLIAKLPKLDTTLNGTFSVYKGDQKLQSNFRHYLGDTRQAKSGFTEVWTEINHYPCNMLEYFAGEVIRDTEGSFKSNFKIFGYPNELHIEGQLNIDTMATTLDYLNSRVFISHQNMALTDSIFLCENCSFFDHEGNIAYVSGGIKHQNLGQLEYLVAIQSDNLKVLDTRKGSNEYFYGEAYAGDMNATIVGPLSLPRMFVDASSNPGTQISFPLTSEQISTERKFIEFGKKDSIELTSANNPAGGFDLNLNLDVNENAEIDIIFDENSNDKIHATGTGNLAVEYDRTGDLNVYGNYDIAEGEYLFTYLNFVNKPFILREGSTIQFTGSPYDAYLGMTADYSGLSAPVYPLIQEYLINSSDEQLERLAKTPTQVDLSMILSGALLSPGIDFEIGFPELDRQLRNFAEAKISALDNIQNDLNRQVFGLLVVGTFLPSQQAQLQGTQLLTGLNTVSQMISNQLSNYITGLVSDLLPSEQSILSGFELDLNYSFYDSDISNVNSAFNSSEIILKPRFYLLDNRVTLDVSGSYNNSSLYSDSNNFYGNFVLGIDLTEDKKWRFRAYQRFEPDFTNSNRSKTGIGVSYRTDFDNFKEFVKKLNTKHKETIGLSE